MEQLPGPGLPPWQMLGGPYGYGTGIHGGWYNHPAAPTLPHIHHPSIRPTTDNTQTAHVTQQPCYNHSIRMLDIRTQLLVDQAIISVVQTMEHCHAPNVFGTVDMEKVSR